MYQSNILPIYLQYQSTHDCLDHCLPKGDQLLQNILEATSEGKSSRAMIPSPNNLQ